MGVFVIVVIVVDAIVVVVVVVCAAIFSTEVLHNIKCWENSNHSCMTQSPEKIPVCNYTHDGTKNMLKISHLQLI